MYAGFPPTLNDWRRLRGWGEEERLGPPYDNRSCRRHFPVRRFGGFSTTSNIYWRVFLYEEALLCGLEHPCIPTRDRHDGAWEVKPPRCASHGAGLHGAQKGCRPTNSETKALPRHWCRHCFLTEHNRRESAVSFCTRALVRRSGKTSNATRAIYQLNAQFCSHDAINAPARCQNFESRAGPAKERETTV